MARTLPLAVVRFEAQKETATDHAAFAPSGPFGGTSRRRRRAVENLRTAKIVLPTAGLLPTEANRDQ